MSQTYVTAEDVQSPKRGVWVKLETHSFAGGDLSHFEITTSTGYKATLPACNCDEPERVHYYGLHLPRAEAFASEVGKTYGSAKRPETKPWRVSVVSDPRSRNVSVKAWVETEWAQTMERVIEPVY